MHYPRLDIDLVYHLDRGAYSLGAVPDPRIQQAAEWIARHFALKSLYASIAIVDDRTIQEVNAQQLSHDWPTDVVSFVLDRTDGGVEGEVIASAQTAERVCAAAGWSVEDELLLYVIHGLLHVAGMDDLVGQDRQAMRNKEQACLLAVGVKHASQHVARFDTVCDREDES